MRIARFISPHTGTAHLGLVEEGYVVDLPLAAQERGLTWLVPTFSDLRSFLLAGSGAREAARAVSGSARCARVDLDAVALLAPYEAGSKILAHVVNYMGHDKEASVKAPAKPFFFQKPASAVANPGDPIIAHAASRKLDHEGELALVIGRVGRNISPADAYAYVGGYTIGNDVSYRDFQMNEDFPELNASYGKNWTQAKGLDMACPLGPTLLLSDELPKPYPLRITFRVNGEVRSDASTGELIHKVPALLAEISRGMTLYPGDVLLTGAPAGGGLGTGRFLAPGDVMECEIERIGVLRNPVIADKN